MGIIGFAIWGLLGAFVYAAPRLLVAISEGPEGFKPRWWPLLEFVVALAFGPIGAAGFTQLIADVIRQTTVADVRAIALVVGMVANPVAPSVVHLIGERILRQVGAPLEKKPSQ